MTCKKWRSLIYDLLDEALPGPDVERVQEHLDGCEKCRRFFLGEKAWAGFVQDSAALQRLRYRRGVPSLTGTETRDPARSVRGFPSRVLSGRRRLPNQRAARLQYYLWCIAAGGVLVLVGLSGFFLFRPHGEKVISSASVSMPEARADSAPRVQVISVEFKGKPAKPYIYQTPKASFIWIAPSKDIGG